jgi:hypothetical protein
MTDWNQPSRKPEMSKDESCRRHAVDLTYMLLIFNKDDPSRVLTVVTEAFGEVGRAEAQRFIEWWKQGGCKPILYGTGEKTRR